MKYALACDGTLWSRSDKHGLQWYSEKRGWVKETSPETIDFDEFIVVYPSYADMIVHMGYPA